ncbi:MAG: TIGR03862 family flavoprotein [Sulfitobacter sp.]
MKQAVVIGAGPAGLMAADILSQAGISVTLCEAKPSVGRKFLMAGKSGLNLTKQEPHNRFKHAFAEAQGPLTPILDAFDATAVQAWAQDLGQEVFTGSTGRVFPKVMKASPLLRSWMGRLADQNVELRTRWQWRGWDTDRLCFDTPNGVKKITADVTVLALGGASWSRLGSTGTWAGVLETKGISIAEFAPANAGVAVTWSPHMAKHFGAALKGVAWDAGAYHSQGEATVSSQGLEGGGIYSVSRSVREGHPLTLDLLPDMSVPEVTAKLSKPRGKTSLSNHLRKTLRLTAAQIALVQEMARPLPDGLRATARLLKALPIIHAGLRPLDEAISTAGGVPFAALDAGLMLREMPGVFVAGEMLDWEAPTGGYLISACLATGRWAGHQAATWVTNS